MTKVLSLGVALAPASVLVVGAVLTGANSRGSVGAGRQGMMPEVVVEAEMPRLVMPTVEVHAVRMVAVNGSDLHVN